MPVGSVLHNRIAFVQPPFFTGGLEQANAISFFRIWYYYNTQCYHKSLENVTPADVYSGRQQQILTPRQQIKQYTLQQRRRNYLQHVAGVG